MRRPLLPAVLLVSALVCACTTTPGATELPASGTEDAPGAFVELPPEAADGGPLDRVEPLEIEGVRGGGIVFAVPGGPEEVARALLDFEDAEGHRAWARSYETLSRDEDRVRTRWRFRGRMGIEPAPTLLFQRFRPEGGILIRFRVTEPDFGIAAFFGEFRIAHHPEERGHSLVAERVFIDSGLWIANASEEDIAAGLREDARLIREWMEARLQAPATRPRCRHQEDRPGRPRAGPGPCSADPG